MEQQKIENSMNLSFDVTIEERKKSLNLNVGYNEGEDTWDAIIKFSGNKNGDIFGDKQLSKVKVVELLNEYAVITATKEQIEQLAKLSFVEYIEKPKRLFFERVTGMQLSGVTSLKREPYQLGGEGVIVGIIDSGIDYRNNEFRNLDGGTRILDLWDQTIAGNPPEGYIIGTEYTKEQIDEVLSLENNSRNVSSSLITSVDRTGHGTEVASIAVGTNGVANKSDIIVVKLGVPRMGGFPKTTELIQGIDYLVRKALKYGKPLSVNLSFGNTYGAHDGSGLVERFIDDISNYWKICICVGTGNEGAAAGHVAGVISASSSEEIELAVGRRETALDLQFWKLYEDEVEVELIAPNGQRLGPIIEKIGTQRYIVGSTEVLLYYGKPSPHSLLQEIYFEFVPMNTYVDSGVWKVFLTPIRIVTGKYNMWLPSYGVLDAGTKFMRPIKENTITVPSTAKRVISVGAYNANTLTYADFSGRGEDGKPQDTKPDIVAPGVKVLVSSNGGIEKTVSGTSFSTPFVTGSTALLMEWGIVRGNDAYLYGDKMKAYLRKGAEPILGVAKYPDTRVGYGRLNVISIFEGLSRNI